VSEVVRERELRGIPRWLLKGYLEQLGGIVTPSPQPSPKGRGSARPASRERGSTGDAFEVSSSDEDVLVGEGWTARLIQMEDFQIGSLRSGQVRLEVRGEPAAVDTMMAALEPRLFRGGG
jgi:hypothetical protein